MMLDQETVVWYSADAPPDADTTVLVYCPTDDAEPVWLGWYEGDGVWRSVDAMEYEPDTVKAWAPLPSGAVCAEAPVRP